jgi:hypothetical protein
MTEDHLLHLQKLSKKPPSLVCPLSKQIYEDPVILVDNGHTFDREHIEFYLRDNSLCPVTRKVLRNMMLVENQAIKEQVTHYKNKVVRKTIQLARALIDAKEHLDQVQEALRYALEFEPNNHDLVYLSMLVQYNNGQTEETWRTFLSLSSLDLKGGSMSSSLEKDVAQFVVNVMHAGHLDHMISCLRKEPSLVFHLITLKDLLKKHNHRDSAGVLCLCMAELYKSNNVDKDKILNLLQEALDLNPELEETVEKYLDKGKISSEMQFEMLKKKTTEAQEPGITKVITITNDAVKSLEAQFKKSLLEQKSYFELQIMQLQQQLQAQQLQINAQQITINELSLKRTPKINNQPPKRIDHPVISPPKFIQKRDSTSAALSPNPRQNKRQKTNSDVPHCICTIDVDHSIADIAIDGDMIYALHDNDGISVIQRSSGSIEARFGDKINGLQDAFEILVCDDYLVIASKSVNGIRVLDKKKRTLKNVINHKSGVSSTAHRCLIKTQHDDHVLAALMDNTIVLWDISKKGEGSLIRTFTGHQQSVNSIALLQSKNHMCSASQDKSLRFWDIETGECLHEIRGAHGQPIISLVVFGDRVASSDKNGMIRIWSTVNYKSTGQIDLDSEIVQEMVMYGDHLASTSGDAIRLWDLQKICCAAIFEGHTETVNAIAVVEDVLISASDDSKLKFWKF